MSSSNIANTDRAPVEATRAGSGKRISPLVDIFENSDTFLIVADLPGVAPNAVSVEFNPPELLVAARAEANGNSVDYERRFELGSGIDPTQISADLKLGVLRIELKKNADLRPRKVQVRAS